jgi:hypothetical protein
VRKLIATALALLGLVLPATSQAAVPNAATPIRHVVMILEENHNATAAIGGMPYMKGLGSTYAHDWTSYSAITHPSLPNYLALTGGSTFGHTNDCGTSTSGCMVSANNIYHQAEAAGGWRQLSESMPTPCDSKNASPYVVHHAPAPFYTDLVQSDCNANDVNLNASSVPALSAGFTFVTPNLNDDAHNGSLSGADAWLKRVVPQMMNQGSYTDGSTLIEIVFDEGSSGNNHVSLVLINPALRGKTLTSAYNHYSLLRLNEELLGQSLLGSAAHATDMRSVLGL